MVIRILIAKGLAAGSTGAIISPSVALIIGQATLGSLMSGKHGRMQPGHGSGKGDG